MKTSTSSLSVPPQVVDALSAFNLLATQLEQDARSARLVGDLRAAESLLRQSLEVRSRTVALAESLVEGNDAPFQARQVDFRRSMGRLHLTCGILAVRLGVWRTSREHGMRAVHFDGQLEHRVLSLLVTADFSEDLPL